MKLTSLLRALREEHGTYLLSVAGLLAAFVWMSLAGDGRIAFGPFAYLAALAVTYRVIQTTPRLSDERRELLVAITVIAGLFGLLGVLSQWSGGYLFQIGVTILIFALFALGLNLEFGYTGILNFGHVAFMAIGAYVTTLLGREWLHHAEALARPGLMSFGMVAASALLAFVVAAVVGNVAAEGAARRLRPGMSFERQRRVGLVAGAAVGVAAVVALLATVRYPLSSMWATTYLIGAIVLIGMLAAGTFGLLLGLPTIRLRADYLAIVTIGFAEIIRRFFLQERDLTGGPQGVRGFPLPLAEAPVEWEWLATLADLLGVVNAYKVLLLLLVAGTLALAYFLYELLVESPYGRVLKGIREDEEVALALGKNVFVYKLQALVLGSALAALAGSFLAWHRFFISPSTFLPIVTFNAWIIIVIGGMGNNKGAVLGAFVLYTFFEATRFLALDQALGLTSPQAAAFRVLLIGVLLILFMMFKPEGLLGTREEMVLGE